MFGRKLTGWLTGILLLFLFCFASAEACTGVRLVAEDGSCVYGRSMEWGAFDLNSRVAIVPRGYAFRGLTPDGNNGKAWESVYGVVALDMLKKDTLSDGMNEKGLTAGLFYHPGTAEYMAYDPVNAKDTITAVDVVAYILTQYATVDEVKKGMEGVRLVAVVEEALEIPVDAHWIVTEPSGKSVVIECLKGKIRFFDNPLGVITNSPSYDWHMTNLRNYVKLTSEEASGKELEGVEVNPTGGASGMIGLPGDFTPPSRFVRAVAWTQTARPTKHSSETVYEVFRILDNFNLPLGSGEGSNEETVDLKGMRSTTLWTTAWDQSEHKLYFHTQHNRRVRKVDLDRIDFTKKRIWHITLDSKKEQDVWDITPSV